MKGFVLGLDGLGFDVLISLIGDGVLPSLKEVRCSAAGGPLRTVFPPVTAPAWLALATGLNPGMTGAFDYINKAEAEGNPIVPISSAYYAGRAVWDLLNSTGRKVGVFNYPTLSPPPKVNGFAVSGIGRSGRHPLCFPGELENTLNRIAGGYEDFLNLRDSRYRRDIGLFFDDIDRIFRKQAAVLKHLVREQEWDFFWSVFSFTDWAQHVLWKWIDPTHPLHDRNEAGPVLRRYREFWRRLDGFIGELLEMLPRETVFMIVSDHGAGSVDSVFYPNSWLEKRGWLTRRKAGWKGIASEKLKLFSAGSDNKYANKILNFLRHRVLGITSAVDLIDEENSFAYTPEHNTMFGCISLTKMGKKSAGFREELVEELRQLPKDVRGVQEVEVHLPAEIYQGPYVELAPDILFVVNGYRSTVEVDFSDEPFVSRPSIEMRTGGHRPEGVFMACGDAIRNVRLKGISVLDVAPTILAMYGVEIPSQIDGRVITEMFRPEMLETMSIRRAEGVCGAEQGIAEEGDLEHMKSVLKSLGYM